MRRTRIWIVLTLALVSGAVAGYLALNLLQNRAVAGLPTAAGTTRVVVAVRDLTAGSIVNGADVKTVAWPTASVSDAYARSEAEVVGRGLTEPVSADEPVMKSKLADESQGGGLGIVIPKGMRALSVNVDEVIGVAGFVQPGSRVDVLVTLNPTSERSDARSKVVLQNVVALATGQATERDPQGAPKDVPVITLLVTPEQAEKLSLASTEGRIQLALRNTLDVDEVATTGARAAGLVAPERTATPAPRRAAGPVQRQPAAHSVVTYDGSERKVTTF